MKYTNITIGADIEVFLQNKKTKEIISAEGYIKGTKDVPFCFDPDSKYFAVSLDNVLAEFCIPPAKTREEFYANIHKSLAYINNSIPKEFGTVALPSARLNDKYLLTEQALVFGCEPDFNAYNGHPNVFPDCSDKNLRSAGGHIHIGYEGASAYKKEQYIGEPERCNIIKALDLFVGIPSLILEPNNKRKELYGKAGAFRPKEYGVEYRTVSNFYLEKPELTHWVYDSVHSALNWLNEGNLVDNALGNHVQNIINSNNKAEAQKIIEFFNLKAA